MGVDPPLPPFPALAWRGLFKDYLTVVADVSECAPVYHYANLLSLLAAEFSDRVALVGGSETLLNFYIFCCGRTGTKKSTATRLVAKHVTKKLGDAQVHHMLTQVSSAEGLIRTLRQRPSGVLLQYDEIKDLFTTAARAGQRIEPTLNTAFDQGVLQANVKRQRDSISAVDYYLCMLLNGTQDHVRLDLSEAFFAGGLLNRFLVFSGTPTDVEMPEEGTPDAEATRQIAVRIRDIVVGWHAVATTRASVHVALSDEARKLHAAWYSEHSKKLRSLPDIEAKPLTRLDTYSKKVSAVYCLVETPPTPTPLVSAEQMAAALDVIRYCEASMTWMTREWSGPKSATHQTDVLAEQRVESYLQTEGCMDERSLYRSLRLSAPVVRGVLTSLISNGVVNVDTGRPRMVHFVARCVCFPITVTS
jgi:hypothetical protein